MAERAGLTERTFFRHFPDKREVLVADDDLRDRLTAAVAAAAEGTANVEAITAGFDAVAVVFQGRREARGRSLRRSLPRRVPAVLVERGLPAEHAKAEGGIQEPTITGFGTTLTPIHAECRIRTSERSPSVRSSKKSTKEVWGF